MLFSKGKYIIREQVAFLRLSDRYDIVDPDTGQVIAYARENISKGLKLLRLVMNKGMFPTTIEITDNQTGAVAYTIKKSFSFLRSRVSAYDSSGRELGYFVSRLFTVGGRFDVFNPTGKKVANVTGGWTGWEFQFSGSSGLEMGRVTRQWGGLAKELFTSADNYLITVREDLRTNQDLTALIIMAALAIDVVYKEKK